MNTPFYLDMTAEERRDYAALLAGQYVDYDDDNDDDNDDGSDDDDNDNEEE